MSNESWKRRERENHRFNVPRIDDDDTDARILDDFLASRGQGPGPVAKMISGLFGVATVVSLYTAAVYFALRAFGLDVRYVDALIISAAGTFIRHLDAAVMRAVRQQ